MKQKKDERGVWQWIDTINLFKKKGRETETRTNIPVFYREGRNKRSQFVNRERESVKYLERFDQVSKIAIRVRIRKKTFDLRCLWTTFDVRCLWTTFDESREDPTFSISHHLHQNWEKCRHLCFRALHFFWLGPGVVVVDACVFCPWSRRRCQILPSVWLTVHLLQ